MGGGLSVGVDVCRWQQTCGEWEEVEKVTPLSKII